jgi:hypothetical protein
MGWLSCADPPRGAIGRSLLAPCAAISIDLHELTLASQLWASRVAATFAIVNFAWLQRATFGGRESLHISLGACYGVLVHPVGINALPAIFVSCDA